MATLQELQNRHKDKSPKRVLSQRDIQRETETARATRGNTFEQEEPKGFLGKARDFATSILGGGELARGAGLALAAPEVQGKLSAAQREGSDIALELQRQIAENRRTGKPTERLETAFNDLMASQEVTADSQRDFTENLPSNRQVVGSAARLGALAGGGALARGAGQVTGVGSATSILGKTARGAGAGVLAGAAEGAVQGAGIAAEKDRTGQEIALGGVAGAGTGAAIGGALGATTGLIGGALAKRREILQQRNQLLQQGAPDSRAAKYIMDGQGRIKNDPAAVEAIKQGVDEGSVALYKGASPKDKQKMLEMLDTKIQASTNKRSALLNRPEGVLGDTVMERFNAVSQLNKQAAKQLDDVARTLQGQTADPSPAVGQFIDDMSDLGVSFRNGKPVFTGSDIEGVTPAQNLVKDLTERMSKVSDDAYELHKLKRFIDEKVAYGKTGEGLAGNTERIVKQLRKNIDDILDNNFSQYNQVNTQYSETRQAIDAFGDVAGKTFKPSNPSVDENVGNLMRRITSNARSRTDVLDSLNQLQETAQRYGKSFDDDVITQVDFVSELENLFGSSAPTSLQGQFENVAEQAPSGGLIEMGIKAARGTMRAARDINEESLEQSLRELLK